MSALRAVESVHVPPHNLEAEESVLGACLLSSSALAAAFEIVSPEDFYKPAHAEMFRLMGDLFSSGRPVDAVSLGEELRRRGQLDEFGGKPYLFTLVQSVPTPGSAAHYARIVAEAATLRRLLDAGQRIMALSSAGDPAEALVQAQQIVSEISQRGRGGRLAPIGDILGSSLEDIQAAHDRGSAVTGIPTGLADLDRILGGLQPGNLIVVAARPSVGKSAWAAGVAVHVASQGVPVALFSVEMSASEVAMRLIAMEARIDAARLRVGALTEFDWGRLSTALGRLAELPLYIDDTPDVSVLEMRAKLQRLSSVGLAVVDYLQLVETPRKDNRVQEVTEISGGLRLLAREMAMPVVALSQLSRNVEYRADKRPVLADIRESGSVEQDAHVVLALYRDEIYHPDSPKRGTAEVIVLKQRNGPTGTVEVGFLPAYTQFVNLAPNLAPGVRP